MQPCIKYIDQPGQYRSAVLSNLVQLGGELVGLKVGRQQFSPHYAQSRAISRHFTINYILKGDGRFGDEPFKEGDCCLHIPGETYPFRAGENGYEVVWVHFRGGNASTLLELCGFYEKGRVFTRAENPACAQLLLKLLERKEFYDDYALSMELTSVLYQLLAIHRTAVPHEQTNAPAGNSIERAVEYMLQHYDSPIRIRDVAQYMNYSVNWFCERFREVYGTTPQDYLIGIRIEKARHLLANPSVKLPISSIAASVGYPDALYFSQVFRKRVGMTPSSYRKRHATHSSNE